MRSDEIARVLRRLYAAISTTSKAKDRYITAPRRGAFLDLHLCLVREGFLDVKAVGAEVATFPHSYAPPAWSEYKLAGAQGEEGDKAAAGPTPETTPEMGGGGESLRAEHDAPHSVPD